MPHLSPKMLLEQSMEFTTIQGRHLPRPMRVSIDRVDVDSSDPAFACDVVVRFGGHVALMRTRVDHYQAAVNPSVVSDMLVSVAIKAWNAWEVRDPKVWHSGSASGPDVAASFEAERQRIARDREYERLMMQQWSAEPPAHYNCPSSNLCGEVPLEDEAKPCQCPECLALPAQETEPTEEFQVVRCTPVIAEGATWCAACGSPIAPQPAGEPMPECAIVDQGEVVEWLRSSANQQTNSSFQSMLAKAWASLPTLPTTLTVADESSSALVDPTVYWPMPNFSMIVSDRQKRNGPVVDAGKQFDPAVLAKQSILKKLFGGR